MEGNHLTAILSHRAVTVTGSKQNCPFPFVNCQAMDAIMVGGRVKAIATKEVYVPANATESTVHSPQWCIPSGSLALPSVNIYNYDNVRITTDLSTPSVNSTNPTIRKPFCHINHTTRSLLAQQNCTCVTILECC